MMKISFNFEDKYALIIIPLQVNLQFLPLCIYVLLPIIKLQGLDMQIITPLGLFNVYECCIYNLTPEESYLVVGKYFVKYNL